MTESVAQLAAGTVIGGTYETLHQIGRGGMGEVWLAKHLRVPRQVAIKVLHTRGVPLTDDARARFKREADIVCRLGHPNIVVVEDHNFLPSVLELLEGEPLSRRLRRGPLNIHEARSVVRQVGSALQAAHHQGVVHRDLKPDNIFLLPSPLGGLRVKVLDFGISKIQDSSTVQTQEAVLVGTPQYMSPEQATGSNKDVGPQSDVFALGSIAYEMLSGGPAFSGESIAQMVFKVAYEKHPPLAGKVAADCPATVVAAVEHALLKDRAQRTPDVATFVVEFTGEPITLTPSAGALPAPQMAVVATPSMEMSASMAGGDTAAPGSQPAVRMPTPAIPTGPATPQVPTGTASQPPVPVPPPTSHSSSAPVASSTSSTAPRRFKLAWVTSGGAIAAAALLAVGFGMVQQREPPNLAMDEGGPRRKALFGTPVDGFPEGKSGEQPPAAAPPAPEPVAVAQTPEPKEPPAAEAPTKAPVPLADKKPKLAQVSPAPALQPVEAAAPAPAAPARLKLRKEVTPEEKARVKDLQSALVAQGNTVFTVRELVQLWDSHTLGVTSQRAVDLMTAEVALVLCRQKDAAYFAWRDRIVLPGIKSSVMTRCGQ